MVVSRIFLCSIAQLDTRVHPTCTRRKPESLRHRRCAAPCLCPRNAQTARLPCLSFLPFLHVQRVLPRRIAAPHNLVVVVVRLVLFLLPCHPWHREETPRSASRTTASTSRLAPPPCTHRCGWEAHACVACEPVPRNADALLRRRPKRCCRRPAGRVAATSPERCVQATWMRKFACADGWMGRGTTVGSCSWT